MVSKQRKGRKTKTRSINRRKRRKSKTTRRRSRKRCPIFMRCKSDAYYLDYSLRAKLDKLEREMIDLKNTVSKKSVELQKFLDEKSSD